MKHLFYFSNGGVASFSHKEHGFMGLGLIDVNFLHIGYEESMIPIAVTPKELALVNKL